MVRIRCRHCGVEVVSRPRGLGWKCFYTPGVRDLYPSASVYARRGVGNLTGVRPPPAEPTAHPPGSPGKAAVLAGRAERGETLWHPLDATEPPPGYTPLVADLLEMRRDDRDRSDE